MLKLSGTISAKVPSQNARQKPVMDAGEFSKLLSSVNKEKKDLENQAPADRLAKFEGALETLEQLPNEELSAEQQELLSAILELLSLQIAQEKKNLLGQKPGYVDEMTKNPAILDPAGESLNGKESLQQRMVELMQQIAYKVQELQANTAKEFADVPMFMGVEKEYILKEPDKGNEVIEVLEDIIPDLKVGQTAISAQQPASAKSEAASPSPVVRMENLAEDLGGILKNSLKLTGTGENAQIKVSIFPEHLGHLEIRLSTVDGKVAAQIFTSNLLAKEALDMQIHQLRSALVQQGITVDRIEISQQAASHSFNHQQEQRFNQQQSQQRQEPSKNGYKLLEEEAAALVRPSTSDGSVMSVDYTI